MSVFLWLRTESYEIRCPNPSEWNLRATSACTSDMHYICLYNNARSDDVYSEKCCLEEFLSKKGKRRVRSPGINEIDCSSDRYQPFIFNTTGNSDCVLDKTLCSEEGQVIANNGSTSTDRACRCDYTKGYVYVTTPRDICSCLPSEEDCTCYVQHCHVGQNSDADDSCRSTDWSESHTCTEIRELTNKGTAKSIYFKDADNISEKCTYAREAALGVVLVILIYAVLLVMISTVGSEYLLKGRPYLIRRAIKYRNELIVETCDNTFPYTAIPGDELAVEWKIESQLSANSTICENNGESIKLVDDKFTLKCLDELTTNVMNHIKLSVDSLHTANKDVVVVIGQRAKLEITFSQSITGIEWFRHDNSTIIPVLLSSEKYSGGTPTEPYLYIQSAVLEDAGRYFCVVKHANNDVLIFWSKLKVIPQEKIYKDILRHRTDLMFEKTAAVCKAFQRLQDHGIVVLTGREGTGKSKMCLELSSMCEYIDYLPYEIDMLNADQREFVATKLLYIIDNVRFSRQSTDQVRKALTTLLSSKQKHQWMVITYRTSEFVNIDNASVDSSELKEEYLINLDAILTEEEKRNIIEKYYRANNVVETSHQECNYYKAEIVSDETIQVKIDKEIVKNIVKTEPFYGFPLTTVRFCRDRKHLRLGEKYFTDPPKKLMDEIKEMYRIAKNEKNIMMINCYTILVYLATGEDFLVVSTININRYKKIQICFPYKLVTSVNEIADAASSMIGIYLTFQENKYTYIHPYISKAVLLSSEYCAENFLIQNRPFNQIKEFVRSALHEPVEDELVYRLHNDDTYFNLFNRIFSDACKETITAIEIYSYMYNQFIKLHDSTFVGVVFKTLSDKFYNVSTDVEIQAHNEVASASVQQISMLLHGLTDRGKDSYIYLCESIPRAVVLYGLIAACNQGYLNDDLRKDTFMHLLSIFQNSFQQNVHIHKSIDIKGNTFFHYLTLYSEDESCRILDTDGLLSIDTIDKISKPNKMGVTPLEIAVCMGKVNVCKRFLLKAKCTNKKKERLLDLIQNGMSYFYGTGKTIDVFDITVNFEDEVRQGLKCGTKDDYLILYDLF